MRRKISQEKLVKILDVSIPRISDIENGSTKFSLQALLNIVNTLNITPEVLLLGFSTK